jgi:hypothetical protein
MTPAQMVGLFVLGFLSGVFTLALVITVGAGGDSARGSK